MGIAAEIHAKSNKITLEGRRGIAIAESAPCLID
jgi:hypothetical protein